MMTLRQFYLTKLAEECQEVAKRAMKSMQFGAEQIQKANEVKDGVGAPDEEAGLTNALRLRKEVQDLLAVIALVENNTDDLPQMPFIDEINATVKKTEKILKYLAFSQGLGMVERG